MKIKLPKPPIYGKKTLRLCFEFGLVLAEVARDKKISLTSEISERAEKILINELKINGLNRTAINFTALILASLEV
jgi:hypothetical protein